MQPPHQVQAEARGPTRSLIFSVPPPVAHPVFSPAVPLGLLAGLLPVFLFFPFSLLSRLGSPPPPGIGVYVGSGPVCSEPV